MHHALRIQEILLNVFDQRQGPRTHDAQLAILARTCLTFKEPALDLLWEELFDLSPLARCLPDATRRASPTDKSYAFTRPLTQAEWDTLQSYTCRIRSIQLRVSGLGRKSLRIISERHTAEPLFPNLHRLRFTYSIKTAPLLRLPLPSITSLDVNFSSPYLLRKLLASGVLAKFSLSLCNLSFRSLELETETLDFARLSLAPLTRLELTLGTAIPSEVSAFDMIHPFPHLVLLVLRAKSLATISQLLAKTRMPAMTTLHVSVRDSPSRKDVSLFLANVQTSGIGPALHELSLVQISPKNPTGSWSLCMEDLRPCMAFDNLRFIRWDIDCQAGLTDNELITLTSVWPHLEYLVINRTQGWNPSGGITPHGLIRLLKSCPWLKEAALALDTQSFVQFPTSETSSDLPSTRKFTIDTICSPIKAESVSAIVAFFVRLSPLSNPLKLSFRTHLALEEPLPRVAYRFLWGDVHRQIESAISQHA